MPDLITPHYIGRYSFNIMTADGFPGGLFDFITTDGDNTGALKLSVSCNNGFGAQVLTNKELSILIVNPERRR